MEWSTEQEVYREIITLRQVIDTYTPHTMKSHAVALKSFVKACSQDGDYSGIPIVESVLATGFNFMSLLPEEIPIPEIEFETDGDLYVEWFVTKEKHFSLIISSDFISYPQTQNGDYCSCSFIETTTALPGEILFLIRSVYAV